MPRPNKQLWESVVRAARPHHGLVRRSRLLRIGVAPHLIKGYVASGRLVALQRDVFLVEGFEATWHARALSACLQCRRPAAVSHWTAARLWELDAPTHADGRIHLLVQRGSHVRLGPTFSVHTSTSFSRADWALVGGVPVTTAARTLVDLADQLPIPSINRMVDDALVRGRVQLSVLASATQRLSRQGTAGAFRVTEPIKAWGTGPIESHAEAEVARWLLSTDLATPCVQFDVSDGARWVARVDFAWPESRLALEVDGFQAHDGPRKHSDDRARWMMIRAAGWDVLQVTVANVRRDPAAVEATLRALIASRKEVVTKEQR